MSGGAETNGVGQEQQHAAPAPAESPAADTNGASRPAEQPEDSKPSTSGYEPVSVPWGRPQLLESHGRELSLDEKFAICRAVAQECIQDEELRKLLDKKPNIAAYDGFEPSGRMHIAQGILKALNVNRLTRCGVTFKFLVADWHAQLNNKMGGDMKKIQTVGQYFVEVWKSVGMEGINDKVLFLSASEEINKAPDSYWTSVMDIARRNNLSRIIRCSQIMGRNDTDELSAAQIFYPCMQCADIFFLKMSVPLSAKAVLQADICQLGMDQRKVNMLAREYCDDIKRKLKPVILSHAMLPGLKQGQEKMSKSQPDSAIFMEDDEASVNKKIRQAFCPPQVVAGNPCIAYLGMIVFPWQGSLRLQRSEANGGPKEYPSIEELAADYEAGSLHPKDLKDALALALNQILEPVRKHFETDANAKALLKKVKSWQTTR